MYCQQKNMSDWSKHIILNKVQYVYNYKNLSNDIIVNALSVDWNSERQDTKK